MAPIGYDTKDRKITVNEAEANHVRDIFRSYLKLGSLNLLMMDLRKRSIVSKTRTLKTGQAIGGIAFTRGPLAHLLRNRFYVAQVRFKGETLAGERPPIVDQARCSMRSRPSSTSRSITTTCRGPNLRPFYSAASSTTATTDGPQPCSQARRQISVLHFLRVATGQS
jgi:hypothetical protein